MNWPEYVASSLKGRTQAAVADIVGVSQTAVSRWLKGQQGVDASVAIRFAKAVGDNPLNALVAAGYLTASEAKVRPTAAPDFSQLTNDELLGLVRQRMGEADGTASTRAGGSPARLEDARRRRRVSEPLSTVPEEQAVAMDDPDLLSEREAQIEDP